MLTTKTKKALETMMVSTSDATAIESLLVAPATITDEKLKARIEIAMADKESAVEMINALENGLASLSKRSSDVLAVAMASKEASLEMFTQE